MGVLNTKKGEENSFSLLPQFKRVFLSSKRGFRGKSFVL